MATAKEKKRKKIIGGVLVAGAAGVALYFLLKKKKSRGSVIVDDVTHVGPVTDDELVLVSANPGLQPIKYSVRWDTQIAGNRLPKNC